MVGKLSMLASLCLFVVSVLFCFAFFAADSHVSAAIKQVTLNTKPDM